MIALACRWSLARRWLLAPVWMLAGVLLTASVSAQEADPAPAHGSAKASPGKAPPAGTVGLDKLLELPDSLDYDFERRGGATRSEWRSRFDDARKSLSDAQAALEAAQTALADRAGGSQAWSVAPPGLPAEAADAGGDSYRLREEVRRRRAEVDRAHARLRDLEVQANLAGVPEPWRGESSTGAEPANDSVPGIASPR